jgi:hypothetical protein
LSSYLCGVHMIKAFTVSIALNFGLLISRAQIVSVTSTNYGNGLFSYTFSSARTDNVTRFGFASMKAYGVIEVMTPPGATYTINSNEVVNLEVTNETAFLDTPITFYLRSCIAAEQHYDGLWSESEESDDPSGLFVGELYTMEDHIYVLGGYQAFAYIGPRKPPQPSIASFGTEITIQWPKDYSGFSAEMSEDLQSPNSWREISIAPVVVGDFFELRIPKAGVSRFIRLIKNCDPAIHQR